jgi:hypothetical protein
MVALYVAMNNRHVELIFYINIDKICFKWYNDN